MSLRKEFTALCRSLWRNGAHRRSFSTSSSCRRSPQELPPTKSPQFNPQLNYRYIRQNVESIQKNAENRNVKDANVKLVADAYDELVSLEHSIQGLRKRRNDVAAEMSKLIQKSSSQSDMKTLNQRKKELANEGKDLKQLIAAKESECHSLQQRLYDEARHIPNLTSPSTPIGGESNAIVVEVVNSDLFEGTSKQSMRDHMAIAAMHDMVDFERAGKVTGSSFYYLRNAGTLLEMALTRFAMQRCMEAGFTPIMTPDVIRHEVVEACGFNPRSDDPQTYFLAEHGQTSSQDASASKRNPNQLCLSATAEFPLAAMYGNEILTLDKLPTKMVAMGKAFRAEGLAGATNRGLYRVHQFTKVEMFSITNKDGSDEALQEIAQIQKSLFQDLELCFRILDMPTHDLGAPAYKKFDMEAWMPGRQTWGEISSASNCTDYQSRRLNIRHFTGGSATEATDFVHTINGTACAVPRLIIALLETHQRENGDVYIPTKLRPYFLGPEVDVLKANQPFLRSFS